MHAATRRDGDRLVVELSGDWQLVHPLPRFEPPAGETGLRSVAFDASGVEAWDSSLLAFLLEADRYCEARGLDFEDETLPDALAGLVALARAVPERETGRRDGDEGRIARLGMRGLAAFDAFLAFARFTGELAAATGGLFTRRVRMRWQEFWVHVQAASAGALPIVTLISFLVGLIIAFLGAVVLRRFGADYYVSYLVSYGVLRELGALMTAVIMAGRTGAAYAAELGSMKITEEIDALKTLGLSPVEFLVVPRFLAVFLMLPLLTVYADFVGVMGGLLVSVNMLDVTTSQFFTGLVSPVTLGDVLLGVFKGGVYGAIIGLAGCMQGLRTGGDAGAVGRSATTAVVTAITLIIVANALIDWMAAVLNI